MNTSTLAWLTWTPRVLTLLFAAFLALFALDVFAPGQGPGETLLALVMHLLPTTVLVLAVGALAWRWELVGTVAFVALAALYVVTTWGNQHWSAHVVIAGPLLLIAALYLASWWVNRRGGAAGVALGG